MVLPLKKHELANGHGRLLNPLFFLIIAFLVNGLAAQETWKVKEAREEFEAKQSRVPSDRYRKKQTFLIGSNCSKGNVDHRVACVEDAYQRFTISRTESF